MKAYRLPVTLIAGMSLSLSAMAADPAPDGDKKKDPASPTADNAPAKPAIPSAATGPSVDSSAQGASTPAPEATGTAAATTPAPATPPKDATMLPQVEVNKSRITNLDIEISEKQRAIDREKEKTKVTRLDAALNNSKAAKTLSIFGGSSADDRSGLASERVRILGEEKEILEAMKTAQTREEKDELKQELDILRQTRRELDSAPK